MTEAQQNRSPAADAPSGAYVEHFTPATIPAGNASMFRLGRCHVQAVRSGEPECLSTQTVYHRTRRRKVNLLGELLLAGECRDTSGRNPSEPQRVGAGEPLRCG